MGICDPRRLTWLCVFCVAWVLAIVVWTPELLGFAVDKNGETTTLLGLVDSEDGVDPLSSSSLLASFYERRILELMPVQHQEYNIPGDDILRDMQTIVKRMMQLSSEDLPTACPAIELLSLKGKYQMLPFQDVLFNQSYCILMTTSSDFPWGTVIVNPPSLVDQSTLRKNLSIDCPHPIHDRYTGEMSIAIFQGILARSLVIAGSYRYASNQSSCQGPTFHMSDAAHSQQTGFHAAVSGIFDYWNDVNNGHYTAIQFHGMGGNTCPGVDAYLTHGSANAQELPPEDELVQLQTMLVEKTMQIKNETDKAVILLPQDSLPPYNVSCTMSGGSNLQGRLLNGVHPDQVCTQAASSVTRRFVHIEQKPWLRQRTMFPIWIDIINQVYQDH